MPRPILRDPDAAHVHTKVLDSTVRRLFVLAMPVIVGLLPQALEHRRQRQSWGFLIADRAVIDMSNPAPELVAALRQLPPETPFADLQPMQALLTTLEAASLSAGTPEEIHAQLRRELLTPVDRGAVRCLILHPHGTDVTVVLALPARKKALAPRVLH